LGFVEAKICTAPTAIVMTDLDAKLILNFLDHLEKDRKNAVRMCTSRRCIAGHQYGRGSQPTLLRQESDYRERFQSGAAAVGVACSDNIRRTQRRPKGFAPTEHPTWYSSRNPMT
jgi:hypothetical protein